MFYGCTSLPNKNRINKEWKEKSKENKFCPVKKLSLATCGGTWRIIPALCKLNQDMHSGQPGGARCGGAHLWTQHVGDGDRGVSLSQKQSQSGLHRGFQTKTRNLVPLRTQVLRLFACHSGFSCQHLKKPGMGVHTCNLALPGEG